MLEKSIIVAAHPDDEILWFSSILDKVNSVIVCFLNHSSRPDWSIGRRKVLSEYPMTNIFSLEIDSADVFFDVQWENAIMTKYGIGIDDNKQSESKYKENYYALINILEKKLIGYSNVFTHNPWGEYGHPEHIQIYRVIDTLQRRMGFNLWYSNYCSNKTFGLIASNFPAFDSEVLTRSTNKNLTRIVKGLYKKNKCWTWYNDWQWPNEESFIKRQYYHKEIQNYGMIFPLNLIKVKYRGVQKKKTNIIKNLFFKILTDKMRKKFSTFYEKAILWDTQHNGGTLLNNVNIEKSKD